METSIPVVTVICCLALPLKADVQTFVNDYAGFASEAGTLPTIDFETQPNGQPSQAGIQITSAYNYDTYGAHFSAPNVTPILAGNPVGGFSLRAYIAVPDPTARTWIVADPLAPVYAAGAHFAGHSYLFAYDLEGALLGYTYYLQGGSGHFLGIVSTEPIAYVVFDRMSSIASIDSFYFAPIPEPSGAALLLLCAGFLLRRRLRSGLSDGQAYLMRG